jgi:hypothetical protein
VVVVVGVAITESLVVRLNPVEGDQLYVDAPVALSVIDEPSHIVGEFTDTLGSALTVTVLCAVLTQPVVALVPVTV